MKRSLAAAILITITFTACRQGGTRTDSVGDTAIALQVDTLIDSCWNAQKAGNFEQLAAANFLRNLNGISVAKSPHEMGAHMKVYFTAFPDLQITLENKEIKGNKVFLHWSATGTNTGVFGEVAATGKKVRINGFSHLFFDEAGMLYREDVYFNELDLLQQLGYTLSPPNLE